MTKITKRRVVLFEHSEPRGQSRRGPSDCGAALRTPSVFVVTTKELVEYRHVAVSLLNVG